MKLHVRLSLLILLLSQAADLCAQRKLSIIGQGIGRKKIELYENDVIRYKSQGSSKWKISRIVALHDSIILFQDEKELKWNQLTKIMVEGENRITRGFQKFFFRGGIIFITLHSLNQLIVDDRPIVSPAVIGITGGLFLAAFLCREHNITRIRLGKRTHYRLLDLNYNELSKPAN